MIGRFGLVCEALALVTEGLRVAALLVPVEVHRKAAGPLSAVTRAREVGRRARRRDEVARRRLKRVIAAIDRRLPSGGNCYRRSLLELALDRGAAAEKLFAGIMVHGGPFSGHAWLESDGTPAQSYDAVITL